MGYVWPFKVFANIFQNSMAKYKATILCKIKLYWTTLSLIQKEHIDSSTLSDFKAMCCKCNVSRGLIIYIGHCWSLQFVPGSSWNCIWKKKLVRCKWRMSASKIDVKKIATFECRPVFVISFSVITCLFWCVNYFVCLCVRVQLRFNLSEPHRVCRISRWSK